MLGVGAPLESQASSKFTLLGDLFVGLTIGGFCWSVVVMTTRLLQKSVLDVGSSGADLELGVVRLVDGVPSRFRFLRLRRRRMNANTYPVVRVMSPMM